MAKLQEIQYLADDEAKKISSSPRDWMGYLDMAARLYRYPFSDTMLIHAQRKGASACASLEDWNEKVGRWVKRGAKGIALFDDSGTKLKLKYVFDVSDTRLVQGGWTPVLWKMEERHEAEVLSYLSDTYEITKEASGNLNLALMETASHTVQENLEDAMQGLKYASEGTYLEGLGEDALRVCFRELLKNSIFYALSVRCGLDPMEYLEEEGFAGITDFNSLAALTVFGNVASSLTEPVLMGIGRTVKKICLKEEQKALENRTRTEYNKFNTLKRETESGKGGTGDGTDIPLGGGLLDPGPDHRGGEGTYREIRDAAEDILKGEPDGLVPGSDAVWETGQASGGDRESGIGEDGSPDEGASGEISGAGQGERPDGVGSPHEQPDSHGGGERLTGIGLQLRREGTEQEADGAGKIASPALSVYADGWQDGASAGSGRFPTVEKQIRRIEERMQALYAGEVAIPADVVDEVLRAGGNQKGSMLRIIYNFMLDQTEEEYTEFVRKEYGTGGRGVIAGGIRYSVWHDELGIQIAAGDSVHGAALYKAFLSWEEVSGRIHQLLKQGEYAPQEVLDNARPNAITEHARVLAYMERDMAEGIPETVFTDMEPFSGSFPDTVEKLEALLAQPGYLEGLNVRLAGLAEAYREDKKLMRSHLHRPDRAAELFQMFAKEAVPYQAREGFIWEEHLTFITQDEVDACLIKGGSFSDWRLDVYSYFISDKTDKEKTDFLRKKYGIGSGGGAVSGADEPSVWYDGKGLCLARGEYGSVKAETLLKWPAVAKRIKYLIESDRYLSTADFSRMPEYEKEQMAGRVVDFYYRTPEDVMRPWEGNPNPYEHKDDVLSLLGNPDGQEALLKHMGQALAAIPADFEDYEKRVRMLADLQGYVEGTYTIFPERKKEIQIGDSVQLSLFDFMDMGTSPAGKQAAPEQEINAHSGEKEQNKNDKYTAPEEQREESGAGQDIFPDQEDAEGHGQSIQADGQIPIQHTGEEFSQEPEQAAGIPEAESGSVSAQDVIPNQPKSLNPVNFRITNDDLGAGGPKQKFRANMVAVSLLKKLEGENRAATPEEQDILSRYVGWGGLPAAFEEGNGAWESEYMELKQALTEEEYRQARASTLNAFYTPPVVIKAVYEALGNMGLKKGNVLEPSCGTGNFMGLVPEEMDALKMYGVEIDSISGRIAGQLYQKNRISIQGFESAQYPDSFFDCVVGNVPFGSYKVADRKYDRFNFLIHDYFIAKSLDLVRPGGVVAVVTSSGTMDKQNPSVRQYIANRADLLGAIRLPENAFLKNAGTKTVADILFFQKRDRAALEQPEWVSLGTTQEGYTVNSYFAAHPEMVLGKFAMESTQFGRQALTVKPISGAALSEQLKEAVRHIHGDITDREPEELVPDGAGTSIPADPSVKNFSFADVDGKVYYRENSRMNLVELPAKTTERVLGMVKLRDTTQELIKCQMEDGSDGEVEALQKKLNEQYDSFTKKYGLISSNANRKAFSQDSSYCLLAALELVDENGNLERKADIFTKRTIRRAEPVTSVDTASEALAVSIGEKAGVDIPFMAALCGKTEEEVTGELTGVIFKNPVTEKWEAADEYLSGNVREKLRTAARYAENQPEYAPNVAYLEKVQPKDLDASEIEVRLGAAWVEDTYITQFMGELFQTPENYLGKGIEARYSKETGRWHISGKKLDSRGNSLVDSTYGTGRANAYRLLEDALNLRDAKIYDKVRTGDGKEKRVLNKAETMVAQQKQEMIREAFKEWVFKDLDRREELCRVYNEQFNSIRPREYDGSHIQFAGMNPEITMMQHQKNAVAHVLYGKNTMLAHCVGAGKTFEMVAAGMESRRLGLSHKNLYVVPNHLTVQWGSDFLRLYPGANILVATKKDFEPENRKKFCSRIATGDYDGIIIGHSQFEKIPLSIERQIAAIERQIDDVILAISDAKAAEGERYTIKEMERTKKSLEAKLEKLNNQERKDNVVIFEELGVDRLFVDESHFYKNIFLYTKMRNVAGIAQTDAQKSSDMFMKCQYMDEITDGRGVTFATGTPISNSMVELYTIMRYLQYDLLQKLGLGHFDAWAAAFGETVTGIELSPEGTGYRAKTRFARFYNLPELMSIFKECADIQTADLLNLPVPEAEYVNEVLKPSPEQQEMVKAFAERAEAVRGGGVDPAKDNMLRITNDGRKCALDQRLLNDMLPDTEGSKVNRCVENTFEVWKNTMQEKSAQLIFCDLSVPKAGVFNVYDDVREKLAVMGVPREQIAFIHEAATETKKAELFAKVRSGQVRILLGSTPKLGAGTNVQDRLIALHHLDCPWKPSELEQQEGRILRQGNRNKKVWIYRYVTESTFDGYMWQILENKQKFISQIMTSKSPVRSCEDVDDTALSYAEIKALATGNVFIKEKMELDIQVSKLKLLKADYTSQKYRLEADIAKNYPAEIAALKERTAALLADKALAAPVLKKGDGEDHFVMEIGGRAYTDRKEAGEALIDACRNFGRVDVENTVGSFRGFALNVFYDSYGMKYVLNIKGSCSNRISVGKDALGNMQRISNALAKLPEDLEEAQQKLENVQRQLAIAKEEVEKPFVKEAELQEKLERLAELNALLNMDEKSPAETAGLDEEDWEGNDISDKEMEEIVVEEAMEEETAGDSVKEGPEASSIWDGPEFPKELACRTERGYFAIQDSDGGYDYTFYGKDYRVVDGGEYERPPQDMPIEYVMWELLEAEGYCADECVMEDYEELMEKAQAVGKADMELFRPVSDNTGQEAALNGQSRAEIEETVLCYAQAQIEDMGMEGEVELLAARVYGSRTREGLYREDSDIDVVISYVGDIREDSFFDILNGGGLKIAGLPVDMNPVSLDKTGTLGQYLEGAERYLDSREAEMKNAWAAPEPVGSMEAGQEGRPAVESGERKSVLAALKEKQGGLERRENMADQSKGHKRKGQEL